MKGLRACVALGAVIASAALATPTSAQGPLEPFPGDDFHPFDPQLVTQTVWLSPVLPAADGGTYRLYGARCFNDSLANFVVQGTWPNGSRFGTPTSHYCPTRISTSNTPIRFLGMGADTYGEVPGEEKPYGQAAYGVTAANVDAVDVLTGDGWRRVATGPVPEESIAAGGLPAGLRYFSTTAPWDNPGPDGPFYFRGGVAVSNGKIAGCSRELSCTKGVSAKRAGKYGKRVKVKRRRR